MPVPSPATVIEELHHPIRTAAPRRNRSLELPCRSDQQVKPHGYRIEPGEIQTRLVAHIGVLAATRCSREELHL